MIAIFNQADSISPKVTWVSSPEDFISYIRKNNIDLVSLSEVLFVERDNVVMIQKFLVAKPSNQLKLVYLEDVKVSMFRVSLGQIEIGLILYHPGLDRWQAICNGHIQYKSGSYLGREAAELFFKMSVPTSCSSSLRFEEIQEK